MNNYRYTFILEGGGVLGCFTAGFFQELFKKETDLNIKKYYGCSAGSLFLPYLVTKRSHYLTDIMMNKKMLLEWNNFIAKIPIINNIFNLINLYFRKGVYKSINHKIIEDLIDELTVDEIKEFEKCEVVAVNLSTGKNEYFNLKDNTIDKLCASSALWLGLPPVVMNNQEYMDGGMLEEIPCSNPNVFDNLTENDIIVVVRFDDSNKLPSTYTSNNIFEYLDRIITVAMKDITHKEYFETFKKKATDVLGNRYIEIIIDENNATLFNSSFDFDKNKMNEAINIGKNKANEFINVVNNL